MGSVLRRFAASVDISQPARRGARLIAPLLLSFDLGDLERDAEAAAAAGLQVLSVDVLVAGSACISKDDRTTSLRKLAGLGRSLH